MNLYDATELAYKNGYEAGCGSMANHFAQGIVPLKPNTELSFGANDGQYDFLVYYRRAKPLNRFQIWMYRVCFGIRARNI